MRNPQFSSLLRSTFVAVALITFMRPREATACGPTQAQVDQWAAQSISTDDAVSTAGISAFRSMGQYGLNRICGVYDRLAAGQSIDGVIASTENLQRLSRAIDAVARQRDAAASRLFWHTDLNQAIEQSRNS